MAESNKPLNFSSANIISLIKDDFLSFTLKYELDQTHFGLTFSSQSNITQSKSSTFQLLGNGIIGVNLEKKGNDLKNIVLSCGIHGNETAPIEICNDLLNQLLSDKLETPHRILFIFGNIPAMHIGKRFVEENLNRLFYKDINTVNNERVRAKELMKAVDNFFEGASEKKLHYDLHTAIRPSKNEKFAVYPFLHGKSHNKEQLSFLSMCGVNTILLSQSPTTTFSYYSSFYHNADSFTVELGKVRPFGQNEMSSFSDVKKSLIDLISKADICLPDFAQCPIEIFTVNQVINKNKPDFKLHFSDDLANFEGFNKGQVLASETGKEYLAEYDGEAVVFPNANVEIGQRALLTVIPYQLS